MDFAFCFEKGFEAFIVGDTSVELTPAQFVSQILNDDFLLNHYNDCFMDFEEYCLMLDELIERWADTDNVQEHLSTINRSILRKYQNNEDYSSELRELYDNELNAYLKQNKHIRAEINNLNKCKYIDFVDFVLLDDDTNLNNVEKWFAFNSTIDESSFIKLSVKPKEISLDCEVGDISSFDMSLVVNTALDFQDSSIPPKKFFAQSGLKLKPIYDYTFDSFEELFKYLLMYMIENNIHLKKCSNCGKYFYPEKRADSKYCDNISPQDNALTCKQYGTKKLWYEKSKHNEATKLYRNIYSVKQMRFKRNPSISRYKIELEDFKEQSKQWKADIKRGLKSEADFIKWLNSLK